MKKLKILLTVIGCCMLAIFASKFAQYDQFGCEQAKADKQYIDDVTFDKQWQDISEVNLSKWVSKTNSQRGLVVGLDMQTGKIISFVDNNSNPRNIDCSGDKRLAFSAYEPGSVMKPLTVAIAFNEKVIDSNTQFEVLYRTSIDDQEISNAKDYHQKVFRAHEIVEASLNNGAIEISKKLGNNKIDSRARNTMFDYYTNKYFLGTRSRLDILSEDSGYLPPPDGIQNDEYRYAVMSFGLGLTTTPLQLLKAYSVILNGKQPLVEPHFGDNETQTYVSEITEETSRTMIRILQGTLAQSGYQLPKGYIAGGKTGTSYTAKSNGTYKDGLQNDTGTYLGFIGKDKPRYLILTRLDEPKNKSFASAEAKKLWQDIVGQLLKDQLVN